MKKRRLKKPIEKILIFINCVAFVFIGSAIESALDNATNFIIYLIILLLFIINTMILFKYTDIFKDDED